MSSRDDEANAKIDVGERLPLALRPPPARRRVDPRHAAGRRRHPRPHARRRRTRSRDAEDLGLHAAQPVQGRLRHEPPQRLPDDAAHPAAPVPRRSSTAPTRTPAPASRITSTTPLQALFLMNDPFVHAQAQKFADAAAEPSDRGRRGAHRPRVPAALRPPADARRDSRGDGVPGEGRARSCRRAATPPSERRREGVGEPRPGAVPEQRVRVRRLTRDLDSMHWLSSHHPTRRAALRSLVGGSLAASRRSCRELLAADAPTPRRPARPEAAALRAEGQARHLPVLDRRRVAHGHVRPQAEAVRGRRQDARRRRRAVAREDGRCSSRAGSSSPAASAARMVSDLFPHLRDRMDDICLIRSMTTDNNEHFQATLAIHTGSFFFARPSIGVVGQLRPGHGEPEPAVVRRPRPAPALRRHAGLRQRLPARPTTRARASCPARSRSRT